MGTDLQALSKKAINGETITLYHGSRGGISGAIRPTSRERCDFGRGFYMGTNPEQAKGLVVDDTDPVFYTLEFDFSKIEPQRIMFLENETWLYAVLAFRDRVDEFSSLSLSKKLVSSLNLDYDVIIGAIADDRMNEAIKRFSEYALTDEGVAACLASVDYGFQVVAKTDAACRAINIVSERDIYGKEADDIRKYTERMRESSRDIVKRMQIQYQRKGRFLNEVIEEERNRENFIPDIGDER